MSIYVSKSKLFFLYFCQHLLNEIGSHFLCFRGLIATNEMKIIEDSFDYIIAGGGLAGCVLADKLSADGTKRVLVLEAGRSDYQAFFIRMPAGVLRLFRSVYDWQYETGGEKACNGRNVFLQRGKVSTNIKLAHIKQKTKSFLFFQISIFFVSLI